MSENSAISEIRSWLEDNKYLNAKTDDLSILAFLRGCKFRQDKTKQKLSNYYTMKGKTPEFFANRDPTDALIKELLELGTFIPLNKYHEERLVVIIRPTIHNPKKHSIEDVLKTNMMVLDIAMQKHFEKTTLNGVIAIVDLQGIGLGYLRQLTRGIIKKLVYSWENYHCRPKQMDFINAPFYINVVLNVFKSFMSEKLKRRIRVHFSGIDALHSVLDKNILPIEYGGPEGTLQELIDYWTNVLVEHKEWFQEDEKYRADLSLE